ncbi:MAG: hypothetical protein JWO24_3713 [Rhodospirillales bacterium]|nr:hypothetical protein [Rhodospirillales bacterium]
MVASADRRMEASLRKIGGLMFGLVVLAGPVQAQKPDVLPPTAVPALPTTKPPPLGVLPPVVQTPPPPPGRATPPTPPIVQVPTPPIVQAPTPAPGGATPAPQPPIVLAPPPPDEPPAIRRLRTLFPPDAQMTYRTATVVDEASQRVRLEGVTVRRPDGTVTFDEVMVEGQTEDGVREADLRSINVSTNAVQVSIARLRIIGLGVRRPAGATRPQPEDVALDRMSIEGLRVDSGNDGVFTLGDLSIEDLGRGRRTRVRLEGLAGERIGAGGNAFGLASAALSGVDIATVIQQMRGGGQPQPQTGRLELVAQGFTFSEGGRASGSVDSLRVHSDTDPTQSGTGQVAVRGLRFDGIPQVATIIRQLGYQSLAADITLDATFQATGGMLGVPAFVVSVPEYGRLTFSAELDRFVPGSGAADIMTNARLIGLALRYRDEGLLARAIRAQALEQRITEAQLREQLIGMARGAASGPALATLRDPVERFLRGQATELEFSVRPPQPLLMGAMSSAPPRDAGDAQRRFGLTATAR